MGELSKLLLFTRFTALPWALLASDERALELTAAMLSAAVPDVGVARSMPPAQRLAMWHCIARFDTSPRHGAYHPLAYMLAWLADPDELSVAKIDRLMCDAGLSAVETVDGNGRGQALSQRLKRHPDRQPRTVTAPAAATSRASAPRSQSLLASTQVLVEPTRRTYALELI